MQCAWREPRDKTRIVTSSIHFLFGANRTKPKLKHHVRKKKTFDLRRKAIILITSVGIILLMITNLTSANRLKRQEKITSSAFVAPSLRKKNKQIRKQASRTADFFFQYLKLY